MKITQRFQVARPLSVVSALFQDIPAVASCMPGAEVTKEIGDGRHAGRVGIRLGPFNASFEGEAKVTTGADGRSGHVDGKGIDKRGGSRSRLILDYRLSEGGGTTEVAVDADIQLSGPIAQFGRTGIITETANVLIGQFVKNVEARLAAAGPAPDLADAPSAESAREVTRAAGASPNRISAFELFAALVSSFFRRLFGSGGAQR